MERPVAAVHPIIFLVDQILYRAVDMQASDIHIEPHRSKGIRVRYRIDGVLYDQDPVSIDQGSAVLSRLKVLSSLDIAQSRVPQDGKLIVRFEPGGSSDSVPRNIDLRVSTFPSIYGEKMVIRILDRDPNYISLSSLGCSESVLEGLHKLIAKPHGFFLVTGPTGSGKTTTLYAILSKLNKPERNIVTMEDPVEYHIDGITQSQVNPRAGFTFDVGLRALLRQDPDVAMVGEIRDRKTAQIAAEAAITGHLVLSTLHTNDSFGAVTRLVDMGIEPFLITASLTGVVAQRLVRLLCSECKRKARGCSSCRGLGYNGRVGIFELLVVDDCMRRMIVNGCDDVELRDYAVRNGMVLLRDDGLSKVREGLISFNEYVRVVG